MHVTNRSPLSRLPSVFVRAGVRGGTGCDTALLLGGSVPDETHTSESLWVVGFSGEGTPLWELAPMFDEPDARGAVLNVAVTHDGDGVVLGYYSTGTPGMIESFPWLARVSSD
jgi:hypothetical protein